MLTTKLLSQGFQKKKKKKKKKKLVATLKMFYGRHHDLFSPYNVAVSRIVSDVFANDEPYVDFQNLGGTVGEACLPSNAYYLRTPDYTLYSGVHVCWSEHSDSSFVYELMCLASIYYRSVWRHFCNKVYQNQNFTVT